MSLSVHAFLVGEDGEPVVLDPIEEGADLAGFESFRRAVWGSPAVIGLGARFFPQLADGDLTVDPGDVPGFLAECALLRDALDAVAPPTDDAHSHDWYLDVVSSRLANIEATARRALELGGGVLIW